ncbi:MAG: hypothetical protein KatS3mg038_1378 [Candidatus Kapaibacterium sp.]|nr:MAG: hypothetical protein KatS3mg038_1378 [Candidatus Kapabacteria bacterium]
MCVLTARGNLWIVCDCDDLVVRAELFESDTDAVRDAPADARIYFVENQNGESVAFGKDRFESEHHTRCFSAGDDTLQRARWLARICADEECDIIESVLVRVVEQAVKLGNAIFDGRRCDWLCG